MISNRTWGLLSAGLFLLCLYFAVAWTQHNFNLPNYNYLSDKRVFMFGIPISFLHSQFWKIVFILPATVLFSVALVKSGFQFPLPQKINYPLGIGAILVAATIILILSTQFLFHETEVTDDENTYDFQAQTLLAGRVVNPPPPTVMNFHNIFIINDGRCWVGRYTLGHPAIIALGSALGNRYIGIITLSLLTLLLLYLIAGELYGDKKVALLALCLGSISPFFYLMSSSRLSHTTSAFFLALFMYLFLRIKRIDNVKWRMLFAFLAGLSLGYAFNVRQLTALGYSLPFIIIMIIDLKRSSTKGFLTEIFFVIGFGSIFIFTLWYNTLVTGNPLRFPYQYYNPMESLGFGVNGHTPVLAFRNLAVSITRLNSVLFGFPLSLLFVFIFLFAKKDFGDRLSLGILGGLAGSYMLFFCPGVSDVGPVYYYEMFIPLILLSARGILFLRDTLSQHFEHGKRFVYAFLILSCIAAVGTFIPERMTHIARLTKEIREPYETVQSANIHRALVMLQPFNYKGWVFSYRNPSPTFSDDIVYCRYADSVSNRTLINYFHDRSLYLLRYNANQAQYEMLPVERNTGRPLSLHP